MLSNLVRQGKPSAVYAWAVADEKEPKPIDPVRQAVGGRLAAARELVGMTQAAVAAKFGVNKNTVSAWETGRGDPGIYTLRTLAKMYKVSADALLWEDAPSIEGMQLAAQYDSLTERQQSTLRALWIAYIAESTPDERVEERMPITKTEKEDKE